MKLMYDLPSADLAAYEAAADAGEKRMYVVPFNVLEDKFVNGWTVVTDRRIYCILDGKVLSQFELERCTVFSTEVLYGNCCFFAVIDGVSTLICRFLSGRNLPRYAVLINACEDLAQKLRDKRDAGAPITNDTPERFCPKCGRPFIHGTSICPFCRDTKEVYMKLWGLTRGLRFMLFFPLIVSFFSLAVSYIVPIIQSLAQLEKNYGKEGAEIIVDNTQLTVFGGFAPNSETAQVLSKSLGTRTVMSGSVSQSKNDPSRSLQMIERPLMTADELKSLPKGTFVVTKTGFNPIKVKLKLFFKWGIQFEDKPFVVPLRDNQNIKYANKDDLMTAAHEKYQKHPHKEEDEIPPNSYAVEQEQKEQNYPESRKSSRTPDGVKI